MVNTNAQSVLCMPACIAVLENPKMMSANLNTTY